ncbi:MAG: hypothetical protein JSR64_13530 [Nitrospira sp.]|nr:hypothetical protein [Nitrospira sp.]
MKRASILAFAAIASVAGISTVHADVEPNKACFREYRDNGGHLIRKWICPSLVDWKSTNSSTRWTPYPPPADK